MSHPFRAAALSLAFAVAAAPPNFQGPNVDVDVADGLYWAAGQGAALFKDLPGLTATRASAGWSPNRAGVYSQFAAGVPRVTDKGVLIETSRTNSIRNNSMVGAVAGTPGTAPTNWTMVTPAGITRQIVSVDAHWTGFTRIRLKYSGTVTTASTLVASFDANTQIVAAAGQVWTASMGISLVAGAWPTQGANLTMIHFNSGGSAILTTARSLTGMIVGEYGRPDLTVTAPANTAYVNARFTTGTLPIGTVVDFTIDLLIPTAEQGGSMSSPIVTAGAAATRAADVIALDLAANDNAMTLVAGFRIEDSEDQLRYAASLTDGSTANRVRIGRNTGGSAVARFDAASVQSVLVANQANKGGPRNMMIGVSHDGETARVSVDGQAVTPAWGGAVPTGLNRIEFGSASGVGQLNGYLTELRGWRRGLLQAALDEATTTVIYHSVGTGQSNMEGGDTAISTTAPYPADGSKFGTSYTIGRGTTPLTLVQSPALEVLKETISTGYARHMLAADAEVPVLVSGQAYGGMTYADIKKGAVYGVYEQLVAQVAAGKTLAGRSRVISAKMLHGEADGIISTPNYDGCLIEQQTNLDTDLRAVTGQSETIPLVVGQIGSAAGYKTALQRDQFTTPFAQLSAALANPNILLLGPQYFLPHYDHAHLTALGMRLWGEYFAKIDLRILAGLGWLPLHWTNVSVVGSDIFLDYHVPVGILTPDTTAVIDPGNLGYNLMDSGAVTITGVTQSADKQMKVSCSAPPPAASRLSFGFHNGTYGSSGPTAGARGCLRDEDATLSRYTGQPLRNWAAIQQHTF